MTDGFDRLIDQSNEFFAQLAKNNTRDWFEANKSTYTEKIKKPALLMADILGDSVRRTTGITHQAKLFRIHRDVRFSKDKTPYNTHLHLMWSQPADGAPVWFFGSSPEYLIAGMGVMGLQGARLTQYRALINQKGGEISRHLGTAQTATGAELSDWGPPPLKKVPKPFDANHPHGDLLRQKSLVLSAPIADDWREHGLLTVIEDKISAMHPLWATLQAEFGQT